MCSSIKIALGCFWKRQLMTGPVGWDGKGAGHVSPLAGCRGGEEGQCTLEVSNRGSTGLPPNSTFSLHPDSGQVAVQAEFGMFTAC